MVYVQTGALPTLTHVTCTPIPKFPATRKAMVSSQLYMALHIFSSSFNIPLQRYSVHTHTHYRLTVGRKGIKIKILQESA